MTTTPEATRLALLADVAAGMSPRNAARKHGVGDTTAYRWLRGRVDWRAAEFALTGGRWVRDGMTLRWEKDTEPEPAEPAEPIACPCGARLSEPCRTTGGNWTRHVDRLTSRRCPCGNVPREGSHFCTTECRDEARAETYRAREQRQPTRTRRAA